jgi:hypothetical protein
MNRQSETEQDVRNVEAWAEVIKDMLCHVPSDLRLDVLALATKNEEAAKAERDAHDGLRAVDITLTDTPGLRQWHAVMRLKSLIVQIFTRTIANNHSSAEAKKILFVQHRYGYGSGFVRGRTGPRGDSLPTVVSDFASLHKLITFNWQR